VGLIFATIGLRQHVFGNDVYGSLLLVILATTLVTPPILRWRLLRTRAAAQEPQSTRSRPAGGSRSCPTEPRSSWWAIHRPSGRCTSG